jgi:hypothetical protein
MLVPGAFEPSRQAPATPQAERQLVGIRLVGRHCRGPGARDERFVVPAGARPAPAKVVPADHLEPKREPTRVPGGSRGLPLGKPILQSSEFSGHPWFPAWTEAHAWLPSVTIDGKGRPGVS